MRRLSAHDIIVHESSALEGIGEGVREMALHLVCISGAKKGESWRVGDDPLLLGRGTECQVCLSDATISRRHCRLFQEGSETRFEDLGSRNPALVNGAPSRSALLNVGDEIAVGCELFVVAGIGLEDSPSTGRGLKSTGSWTAGEPIVIEGDPAGAIKARPRTIQDFVTLHNVTREFGQCETVADLVATTARQLRERFNPLALWIARVHGEDDLSFFSAGADADPGADAPLEIIRRVLREKKGVLAPKNIRSEGQSIRVSTLAAPVSLLDGPTGVLVVQTRTPHGIYSESDLQFLSLIAEALAPFIHSVEHIEQLTRDNERLRVRAGESLALVGDSRAMSHVRARVREAAKSDLNVLVSGETGTGKELAARLIHAQSNRASGPLVIVNCAAIPRELFEGEMFGHEKGAYTGADEVSAGLVARAHGGTLFLDEVGDLSLDNQARILRVVEYGAFRRVGASAETHVNVRVVAATNKDIKAAITAGEFRADLYHRLNGFEIHIPPLRERRSDIPVLAGHFFEIGKPEAKRTLTGIASDALEHLRSRLWPGNVRELRNCILRAIAVARQDEIRLQDVLEQAQTGSDNPQELSLSLVEAEKRYIASVLRKCNGNARKAAKILQISRSTLYRKINEHQIG